MKLNQAKAPLYERLLQHRENKPVSFHVPGHKYGCGLATHIDEAFHQIMTLDLTEITGMDDLHHAEDVILEAEQLAAQCFGAEVTKFLVGGSTVGNMAMILSVCKPGDLLLVQRDAHKSVLHALMLAQAKAVFLTPQWDEKAGISLGIDLHTIEAALKQYPEAKGVFLTNPSYYGAAIDLQPYAKLLHDDNKVLLVDEAHGAHFGFHPDLPPHAMSCGADAAVQSTHKMLTSMTMSAMLHIQGNRIRINAIHKALALLQSSSPSYPLLASLDLARRQLALDGPRWIEGGLAAVARLKQRLQSSPRWAIRQWPCTADPFKQLLYDRKSLWSGYRLKEHLETYGCYPELADPVHVLLAFGPGSTMEHTERLLLALQELQKEEDTKLETAPAVLPPLAPVISLPVNFRLEDVLHQETSTFVELEACSGHIAAEMITPYPPGIAVLHPGEPISVEIAAYLQQLANSNAGFHGHDVTKWRTVPVRIHGQNDNRMV